MPALRVQIPQVRRKQRSRVRRNQPAVSKAPTRRGIQFDVNTLTFQSDQTKHRRRTNDKQRNSTISDHTEKQLSDARVKYHWTTLIFAAVLNLALLIGLVVFVNWWEQREGVLSHPSAHRTNDIDGFLVDVLCRLGAQLSLGYTGPGGVGTGIPVCRLPKLWKAISRLYRSRFSELKVRFVVFLNFHRIGTLLQRSSFENNAVFRIVLRGFNSLFIICNGLVVVHINTCGTRTAIGAFGELRSR